jgi:hypothetical protein
MLGQNVAEETADLACKLFVFHAPHDSIVHASNADVIVSRASTEAAAEKIILDEEATHLFENRNDDAVFVAETIMQWCRMHLK